MVKIFTENEKTLSEEVLVNFRESNSDYIIRLLDFGLQSLRQISSSKCLCLKEIVCILKQCFEENEGCIASELLIKSVCLYSVMSIL